MLESFWASGRRRQYRIQVLATEVWTGCDQLLFQHQCSYPLYHYCHHLGSRNRLNTKLIKNSLAYGVSLHQLLLC